MSIGTVMLVAGARPNFMKIAPLWRALRARHPGCDARVVHTGQHYDERMSQVFFDQFDLPPPHVNLEVGSGTHTAQTAAIMTRFDALIDSAPPDMVIVVGDVNSTLAAALVAARKGIPVAHVEAGLRSFDRRMPEENNRIGTDRVADYLFVSEPSGVENLQAEGIDRQRIHLVGNCMIDTLVHALPRITAANAADVCNVKPGAYSVATFHRPSNVDSDAALRKVAQALERAAAYGRVIFPVHPRTTTAIRRHGLEEEFAALNNVRMVAPMGYIEFISLVKDAYCVLTDSGGIQEETTWLGVPCITARENTERPLTVTHGTNRLTGLDLEAIECALAEARTFDRADYSPPELWDGHAAERIVGVFDF